MLAQQSCGTVNRMVEELIDKWADVIESSDDWVEKNLVGEFLDDLRGLIRG